ncbi:MAG: DUF4870 domain-containing protein [Cyanobacteria bacterium P01_A01_bin.84]
MQDITYNPDKRKLLSCLAHGAIFFSTALFSIGIPIVISIISDDAVVKENAKESINFHLNVWFWATVIGVPLGIISWITFGLGGIVFFPVVALGFAIHWGLTIWAIAHALGDSGTSFRYPFIFRLF